MKTRKIVLLVAIVVLAVVYILQLTLSGGSAIKDLNLAESPDAITLARGDETISLVEDAGKWLVGEKKYPADANAVQSIVNDVKNIRVLDTVSRSGDYERYGLDDTSAIVVKASKGGKDLRTIRVGKAASTSQQTYIQLDGGKEVLLVSGSQGSSFGRTVEDLRDKNIYSVNASDIVKIAAESENGTFVLEKQGDPATWTIVEGGEKIDTEKVANWVGGITNLRATAFAPETAVLPPQALSTVNFTATREISVSVYDAAEEGKYLIKCSESPYAFYVSSYTGEKYLKKLEEL